MVRTLFNISSNNVKSNIHNDTLVDIMGFVVSRVIFDLPRNDYADLVPSKDSGWRSSFRCATVVFIETSAG